MEIYRQTVSPVLDRLPSEPMHVGTRELLHLLEANPLTLRILKRFAYKDPRLQITVAGILFENPLLVGAGWDKAGRAVRGLNALGFSGVEVGSVLEKYQKGNDRPRQWYFEDGVGFNRLGFNTPKEGLQGVIQNLHRYKDDNIPIGISLGKNKEVGHQDAPRAHAVVADALYDIASYFVVNVSSPNTPGLRELQDKSPLTDIVQAVNAVMDARGKRKPLFVKIAPDLTNDAVDDVIDVIVTNGLTGIIATNTTNNSEVKAKYGRSDEMGGISGNDSAYRRMSTEKVAHAYNQTKDLENKVYIIGVGGIYNAETALEKIMAGATLIQTVTGIRYGGPSMAEETNKGIAQFMKKEGYKSIEEMVGIEAHKY